MRHFIQEESTGVLSSGESKLLLSEDESKELLFLLKGKAPVLWCIISFIAF
jgi:hypothetical protein